MSPQRIHRKRTKGWRMPEGAIYVGRPTKWGNPFTIGYYGRDGALTAFQELLRRTSRCSWTASLDFVCYPRDDEIRAELAGHDLACWCPLDQPCHADVLIELAAMKGLQ